MDSTSAAYETLHKSLDLFLDGWRTGDAGKILRAVADEFVYDDPIDGRYAGPDFAAYLAELLGDTAPDAASGGPGFEGITDIVTQEKDGQLTAWGWWKTASEEGAGLVKVGPNGVMLEKTAYYRRPEDS